MSKARAYCFTINNPTDKDLEDVKQMSEDNISYIIVGNEVGDEEGTQHYQGYVYFKTPRSFKSIKKAIPRAHIEVSKGNAHDNMVYCSKQGEVILQKGEPPKQGARTDIEKVVEELKNGSNMRAIVETARSCQSIKMAEVYLKYHEKGRDYKPIVKWYFGKTGTGKTKNAYEELSQIDDVYFTMNNGKWWEGYDAHDCVIIDDMREDFCSFHTLLRLLDRYPVKVETKGGSRQFLAKHIIITCPLHPYNLYCNQTEDVEQLMRRIDEIKEFK